MASTLFVLALGVGALLFFLSPSELVESAERVEPETFALSLSLFVIGCLAGAARWRACMGYRTGFAWAFHSLGVANAGNLLIPGRAGEPLRVFCLSRKGVAAEYSSSGIVQERLGDQVMRLLCLGTAILLASNPKTEGELHAKLLSIAAVTVLFFLALGLAVRYGTAVSKGLGGWVNRLPYLSQYRVEKTIHNALRDLGGSLATEGGRKALFWGLVCWAAFGGHTAFILTEFFTGGIWALTCVIMAVAPPTAPTKPGVYHGLVLAGLLLFTVNKILALQVAVVLHLFQFVLYTVWGLVSWRLLTRPSA